ncbi:hypothetical protein L6R29_20300 [Myxococcota bacterium]|nr:hypothetical protein [Myxococcota bacterium]
MKRKTLQWLLLLPFVVGGIIASVGCAQDLPDIDRTQPRALKKSIFRPTNEDGTPREWYFRQTVIEVPYGTGASFVGEESQTEKIVWKITERFLYAYRSREYVLNTDKPSQRPGTEYEGTPIAAFRIESHFDIQRSYNPATGEQNNVIIENTMDRPWDQREHFRVDFGQNLIADFAFVASNVSQQPVSYYIPENEVNNKDRAKIGEDYVDIVQKLTIQPEVHPELSAYYGRPVPTCWLYSEITRDCMGQTIKVRASFKRVARTDYQAKPYDDKRMAKFGYFRQISYTYDRGRGILENNTNRTMNRWPIWRDEAQCAKPNTRLSHADCKVRQFAYHLNDQYPAELKAEASEVIRQWNQFFREAVQIRSGKDQGDIFVLCLNNPIQEGDPAICGKPGDNPQIGDIRYSFLYWVNRPHRASPLGYGPSTVDPLTGEVVAANAYIYGGALDSYTAYATDIVRLINGDAKTEDIGLGKDLQNYLANQQKLGVHGHIHWHGGMKPALDKHSQNIRERMALLKEQVRTGQASYDWVAEKLKRLEDSPSSAGVIGGEIFQAFNLQLFSPSGQITPEIQKLYGPQRIATRQFFDWSRQRMERLSTRNVMMTDFVDDGVLARALKMKGAFAVNGKIDYEKVYAQLRKEIFLAVTLHEFGHNVGLRHNFSASADALNYHDKYWELRAKTIPEGENAPLPFYRYAEKDAKLLNDAIQKGLHEYQYSSIMDYGSGFASDLHGLGRYDRAAILYGYADAVEVFKKGTTQLSRADAQAQLAPDTWHYTQLPRVIAGNKPVNEQIDALKQREIATLDELAKDNALIEIPYRFCSDEVHQGQSDCNRFDQGADPYERVRDTTQRYFSYYIFNAYKRGRLTFGVDVGSYISRIYDRYFMPIAFQYKHFVNDGFIAQRFEKACNGNWYQDPRCGESGFIASIAALNFFSHVMQTPDSGCYKRTQVGTRNVFTHQSNNACTSKGPEFLDVPFGVGRPMLGAYDRDTYGYEFYWKPVSLGAWWDKYLAAMALGDPYTRFIGVDSTADARSYLINFTALYGTYVNNILGGFLAERPEAYAPMLGADGKISLREPIRLGGSNDLIDPAPVYNFTTPLDPNEQYTARLLVGFIGAVYFSRETDDQRFNEAMKIAVRGRAESPDVPEAIRQDPKQYVEIVEPGSNRIYYAVRAENRGPTFSDAPKFFSAGYELLKNLKDQYYENDGSTLKPGVRKETVMNEFHYINVILGWLHAGEYNNPR